MTPEEFRDKRNNLLKQIKKAHDDIQSLEAEIRYSLTKPAELRDANHLDIRVGNILWYKEDDITWRLIEIVYDPKDYHRCYMAHDGISYGLKDALVEV